MISEFKDFKYIMMLSDMDKNIVIFPISKSEKPVVLADGSEEEAYLPAFYPIELKKPFGVEELSKHIQLGIEQWNVHQCYDIDSSQALEEKYYGKNGCKNATKGIRHITLGWDDIQGKYVSLSLPLKNGSGYIGIDETILPDDATWEDFSKVVMYYVNSDNADFSEFKTFRNKLNI